MRRYILAASGLQHPARTRWTLLEIGMRFDSIGGKAEELDKIADLQPGESFCPPDGAFVVTREA